jgi:hypothetical protein
MAMAADPTAGLEPTASSFYGSATEFVGKFVDILTAPKLELYCTM